MKVYRLVLLALLPSLVHAVPAPMPLSWKACDATVIERLGPRHDRPIQCAELRVPRDHRNPSLAGHLDLPVYRIKAPPTGAHLGTLLFLPDSPSLDPLDSLGEFVRAAAESNDDRKRLLERFDIIGLAPRGSGAIRLDCHRTDHRIASTFLLHPSDDAAWRTWVEDSRRFAMSCGEQARYVSTAQFAGDIESLRLALGVRTLHAYAHGYGTWVATWYGSLHPEGIGRFVLDGTHPFDQRRWISQLGAGNVHPDRMLRSRTAPAAVASDLGLSPGMTASHVTQSIKGWPLALRRAWAGKLGEPEDLVAALAIGDLWRDTPIHDLRNRLAMYHFHPSPVRDEDLRERAARLVDDLDGDVRLLASHSVDGISLATTCNDSAWTFTPNELREFESFDRSLFLLPSAERLVRGLPCHGWPHGHRLRPPVEVLAGHPLLMVHAATDAIHPWPALAGILHALPSSRLVVDERRDIGPLMTQPRSHCSTLAATRYLLTGDMPSEATVHCSAEH